MPQSLSILHVLAGADATAGGPWHRRIRCLVEGLDMARHAIAVEDPGALPKGLNATFLQNPPPLSGKVSVGRYEAVARAMRGYDLVLSYGGGAIDAAMARRAFARVAPPVVHHEDPAEMDALGGRLYRRIALGAAAALVVSGENEANAALARWKLPRSHVHAIPDGIDLSAFTRGPDAALVAPFRRNARELVIGIVADLSGGEDVALLVRAVAGLASRFRLVVIGEGPARGDIERAALAMGIDDRLVMPGAVVPSSRFLGGFDLLLLPMRWGPASPIVIEAMAAGLPIIGLRGGAAERTVAVKNRPYFSAFAGEVQIRDAIQLLATDASLRAAIGAANRVCATAQHDEARMIARSAALYAAAADRPGSLG